MKHLVVLVILFALTAGHVLQLPSSFENGIKWEFGTNVFNGDVLARSNFDQAVPTVYKKELVAPIARREPVVTTVYKKPPVILNVYNTPPVVPTVYKKEPIVQSKQQSVIPAVFKTHHSVASNIYKSQPVAYHVYKQQAAVPIVHNTQLTVSK